MGDINTEEILAEPDEENGFISSMISFFTEIISSNYIGWYLFIFGAGAYFLWRNYGMGAGQSQSSTQPKTPEEIAAFQSKEEARLKAIEKLQSKYNKESEVRAEKLKKQEDEKRRARLAEIERLSNQTTGGPGHVLGDGTSSSKKNSSLRPEYNPLMGDDSSRVCFRRSAGAGGGG